MRSWLDAFIPQHVSGKLILGFFSAVGRGTLIKTQNTAYNYEKMTGKKYISAEREEKGLGLGQRMPLEGTGEAFSAEFGLARNGQYIENQPCWDGVRFGRSKRSNMAYSGCEILACYNALVYLTDGKAGNPETLVHMIECFERRGAALLGAWGTSPRSMQKFFDTQHYHTKLVVSREPEEFETAMKTADCALITLFNDKCAVTGQVHTMTVTREEKGYVLHNAFCCRCGETADGTLNKEYCAIGPEKDMTMLLEAYDEKNRKKSAIICMIVIDKI